MAYEKQNWECGQVITADKLNHMEDGIANAGGDCDCGVVHIITPENPECQDQAALDKTYNEILSAIHSGQAVMFVGELEDEIMFLKPTYMGLTPGDAYGINLANSDGIESTFVSDSADGELRTLCGDPE